MRTRVTPGFARLCARLLIRKPLQPGLATYLSNDSSVGGKETHWIVTTLRPEGLVSFVYVASQPAYEKYDKTFDAILDSVRFGK